MNTCQRCGVPTKNAHFCGRTCAAKAIGDFNRGRVGTFERRKLRRCEQCGAPTKNAHLCSLKCTGASIADFQRSRAKPVVLRACEVCGASTPNKHRCSQKCHNAALRLTGKGTWFNAESGGKGPDNPNWRGDNIGYDAAHGRVKRLRGTASKRLCEFCLEQAKEWAYDHLDPNEKRDKQGPYSPDPARYMPLCRPCHRTFDNKKRHDSPAD